MCCEVLHVDQQEQALTESNIILSICTYVTYVDFCWFITYIYHLFFWPLVEVTRLHPMNTGGCSEIDAPPEPCGCLPIRRRGNRVDRRGGGPEADCWATCVMRVRKIKISWRTTRCSKSWCLVRLVSGCFRCSIHVVSGANPPILWQDLILDLH